MRIRITVGSVQGATAMLAYFQVPLTWTALLRRTARETQSDNGAGLAAQLAYYFFLALFPALLFMLALVSFFPVSDLPDRLVQHLWCVSAPHERHTHMCI